MMKKQCFSFFLMFCFLLTLLFPVSVAEETETKNLPVGPIKQVASGSYMYSKDNTESYYAVIDTNDSLWMWGSNGVGQLGDGTAQNRSAPVKIMDGVASVSLGTAGHSAAIGTDGSLWTWGNNNFGQLGDGTTTSHYTPVKIMDDVSSVSLGGGHSAAIRTDSSLWTWGNNWAGALGDGTNTNRSTPMKIMDNVTSVSLGSHHSAAVDTDGSLWTWGSNSGMLLGDDTRGSRSTPKKIMYNVSSVSLADTHSAAIHTDGSLLVWGWNGFGQIGNGLSASEELLKHYAPTKVLDNVAAVSLGNLHSAAILTDGSLLIWGGSPSKDFWYYQSIYSPRSVAANVLSVSAGYTDGLFISKDGTLRQYGIPLSISQIEVKFFPDGIYFDKENLTLPIRESATLKTSIYPESDRDTALVWSSSNPNVATVDNGTITAHSIGETDITVMATKTWNTAVCHVTVPQPLSLDKDALTLRIGETHQLTPTVQRADGEEKGIAWFSNTPAIVSVSDEGTVSALASGSATVSVVTLDGEYKADCMITVPNEVSGVSLDRTSLTMKPGDSTTLAATVIPEDAVEQDVRWMSNAPNIATVSNGVVKAWSIGKTTITVETASGGFTASCTVNVTESEWPYSIQNITTLPSQEVSIEIANHNGEGAALMVASYNESGKMLHCKMAGVSSSRIATGTSGTLTIAMQMDDAATIKAFLLDSDFRPIALSVAKQLD